MIRFQGLLREPTGARKADHARKNRLLRLCVFGTLASMASVFDALQFENQF